MQMFCIYPDAIRHRVNFAVYVCKRKGNYQNSTALSIIPADVKLRPLLSFGVVSPKLPFSSKMITDCIGPGSLVSLEKKSSPRVFAMIMSSRSPSSDRRLRFTGCPEAVFVVNERIAHVKQNKAFMVVSRHWSSQEFSHVQNLYKKK